MSRYQSRRHDLLSGLPSSTQEYAYLPDCFEDVYRKHLDLLSKDTAGEESPYIIFTGVDQETFDRDFGDRGNHYDSYIPSLKLVLVNMITKRHELAHRNLDDIILWHLHQFTSQRVTGLQHTGAASRMSEDREKRPDTSYEPEDLPEGRSDQWPSFVIEAGLSGSRAQLERDARWWIEASKGDVKGVITTSVGQASSRLIEIKYWQSESIPLRSQPDKNVIKLTHHATISQANKDCPVEMVSNAPFIIPFKDLYLRDADVNGGECDVVISREELERYAIRVWKGNY